MSLYRKLQNTYLAEVQSVKFKQTCLCIVMGLTTICRTYLQPQFDPT